MTKKIHIAAGEEAGSLAQFLERKGYRYGYSGSGPCQRRSPSNMPFITIDLTTGFYSGTKGRDAAVRWENLNQNLWYIDVGACFT